MKQEKTEFQKGNIVVVEHYNLYYPKAFGTVVGVAELENSICVSFLIPETYGSTIMIGKEYWVPKCDCHLATKLEKAEYAILRLNGKGGLVG